MSDGCGLPVGGPSLDDVDIAGRTIVQGRVIADGAPVDRAYVQLINVDGDFVAEVVTNPEGGYRFFAAPGTWTLSALHRIGRVRREVVAEISGVTDVVLSLRGAAPSSPFVTEHRQ
jgi:hypothetical protein